MRKPLTQNVLLTLINREGYFYWCRNYHHSVQRPTRICITPPTIASNIWRTIWPRHITSLVSNCDCNEICHVMNEPECPHKHQQNKCCQYIMHKKEYRLRSWNMTVQSTQYKKLFWSKIITVEKIGRVRRCIKTGKKARYQYQNFSSLYQTYRPIVI